MSTVTGRAIIELSIREVISSLGGEYFAKKGPIEHAFSRVWDLANGTSDGQINKVYSKVQTGIGSAVTTVYDLIGTLTDADAAVINFDEVVGVLCFNLSSTAANYLTLGPDATNGFGVVASNKGFWVAAIGSGGGDVIPADGESFALHWCKTGVPAAAGSTDELSVVTQSGTSANTWFIMVFGRDN